jgi:NAD(P)-dependent dehydrogenase (short-subunit alcohol dehydrogenase family)
MAVVLVTGSSSGIGLATAVHFAQRGYDVHAGVRNLATATDLTGAIAAGTLPIRPVVLDVNERPRWRGPSARCGTGRGASMSS